MQLYGLLGQTQFDPNDKRVWIAMGVAMLAATYLVLRPMLKKKKDPLEKLPFSNLHTQRSVERQMQHLLVELSEMVRQMNAQIDTRAGKLEVLIREADEKLAALKDATGSTAKLPAASPGYVPPPPADRPAMTSDSRHAQVYALADEGRNAGEIASSLDRPKGEIELILALRARG